MLPRAALLSLLIALLPCAAAAAAGFGPVDRLPVDGRVLAGTPDDGVVVADGSRLRRYEADWTRSLDVSLGGATDVAVGPGGLLYLADPDEDVVRVLSEDGRQVGTLGADVLDGPQLVAAARDGRVAVADREGVTRFEVDGRVRARSLLEAVPADLALDGRGTVYTLDARGRILRDPLPGAARRVPGLTAAAIAVDADDRLWASDTGGGGLVRLSAGAPRRELVCPATSAVSLASGATRLFADETVLGPDSDEPCGPAAVALRRVTLTRTFRGGVRLGFRLTEPAFVRVSILRPRLAVHEIGRSMPAGRRHISIDSVTNHQGELRMLHEGVRVRVHAEIGLRRSREVTRSLPPG